MNRRGAAAMLTALAAIPLIAAAGLAVDGSRAWLVRSRLVSALDAAALAGARNISLPAAQRNAEITGMFWTNFLGGGVDPADPTHLHHLGFMGASAADPVIKQVDGNTMSVSVQATLGTTFMRVVGVNSVTVTASTTAARATTGMELALVLDNTGSMKGWPIQALRQAATDLVNNVYGSDPQDTRPNLWVSVVPFTAEVNIGSAHTNWLVPGSLNQAAYANTRWMGCVFARIAGGHDADDATPATAPFTPFIYPSTHGAYTPGDDDWTASRITETNQANLADNTAVGPNLGCSPLAVLPLTPSRSAVLNIISQMVQVFRGGTFINQGLQAGWFTLSPRWRGLWGGPAQLPLDYNTPLMRKVIVLMTDGNNDWYSWDGGGPDYVGGKQKDTDVTSYGRTSEKRMGAGCDTRTTGIACVNASMSRMCTAIKAAGITVYAVLFNHDGGINPTTATLFQNCASSPDKYFVTPTQAQLDQAFQQIGTELASLRIVQ